MSTSILTWTDPTNTRNLLLIKTTNCIIILGSRSILPNLNEKMMALEKSPGYTTLTDLSTDKDWHFIIRPALNWQSVKVDITAQVTALIGYDPNDAIYM